jgi:eukaryotic-like serine/threonine-protein kinase
MSSPILERLNAALTGRYHVVREIGEGGMATVFLADDLRHDRKVALKVLRPDVAAVVGAERFLVEIKTTARLQHPRILPLFDSGQAASFLFYVMPYVEGETLRQRLNEKRQLPVDDAVRIATQVAEALEYAHRQGIIHRDIKPGNVLLAGGDALVADFGIARALGASSGRLTETGLSLGTPQYMSPEQATGDASTGPETDIWSLGCVLYEMLAGEPPHRGSTPQAILGSIVAGVVDSVSTRRPTTPPNVASAVQRALERVPSDRFESAGDFKAALADASFRYGVAPVRRRWVPVAAAAGVAYALGMATWLLLGFGRTEPPAPVRFVIPDVGSGSLGRALSISPDGSVVAHGTGSTPLVLRRLADFGSPTQLGTEAAQQPFFSPDGQWVGHFQGISQGVHKVPIDGGPATLLAAGTGARAVGGSWGSDGTIVFATTSGLYRVSADGGEPHLLKEPDRSRGELYYAWPLMLPRSRAVLYTVVSDRTESDGDATIVCLDLVSGDVEVVLTGGSGARLTSTGHLIYSAEGGALHAVEFDPASCAVRGERVALGIEGIAVGRGWGADFDVSPGGTLVYLLADQEPGFLVWLDRSGQEEQIGAPRRAYTYVRLSPDGQRIAVDVGSPGARDIYILDVQTGGSLRLTNEPGEEFFAHWSIAGDSIYFSSNQLGGTFDIFRRAADGTGPAELVLQTGSAQMLSDVMRDGSLVVSESRTGGSVFDLTMLRRGATDGPEALLATASAEYNAVVAPDGELVAYQSNATGQYEVYVSPLVGASRARWKVSIDGGEKPLWSARGDTVFFRSRADSMMAAALERTADGAVRVGVASALFHMRTGSAFGLVSGRQWDLSSGDGRFVIPRRPPGRDSGMRVVLGWTQELLQAMER